MHRLSVGGSDNAQRATVVVVKGPDGALSLELMHLRDRVHRAFLKQSPRSLRPSEGLATELSSRLSGTGATKVLVADNRRGLLARSLASKGWRVSRAVTPLTGRSCSLCTTYDLPLDERLQDDRGEKLDMSNTSHMVGVSMDIGGRHAYGFYTDEGETARVVSEGARKQGMLVAYSPEDMAEAAACLVRFLASAKKKWAVFSADMGRFVRPLDPTTMWRMVLEGPRGHDHSVRPVSRENRKAVVRLFSEYYDEGVFQASFRLRNMLADKAYSVSAADGGFVVTKLNGETGLVYDIYVTPAYQGARLGEELMRCALSSLAGRASSVYLHTSYPRAKAMYEKFGFKPVYSQLVIRLDEICCEPPST